MTAAEFTQESIVARLRAAGCVFAEDEARLLTETATDSRELASMIARRESGTPLEQVLGWAEFCGTRIIVEPDVFVPRRRTELLVREAVGIATSAPSSVLVVVELCCGSGAVGAMVHRGIAEAGRQPAGVELHVADNHPAAVHCARRNIPADAHCYLGDLFAPLPATLRGNVDLIVANAPYVPSSAIETMPPEARHYEPRDALDGGTDGLEVQRRIIADAPDWLASPGHVLVETSRAQAAGTAQAMHAAGLRPRTVSAADLDATVLIGQLPAAETVS
ncbi:release factor glutamine methyltransferase [Tamaricihabitans halophyticus]|uniref:Release factor glutamine methyltransferase n=1 Tax=Tamaricihabitans halophyticus TaxID=1262583 RepID=A0A4R2QMX6_9PSEU|nr:putative protein N(5)-glutamine methyltransferase [Tamaricihabitans halophyticus]TCP50930.1 release factor glutamine methyltransferase [Tamaricihabitans halophyticus]